MSGDAGSKGGDGPTILDVYTKQIRVEAQLEQVLTLLTAQGDQLTDHETRLRTLEDGASGNRGVQRTLTDHESRLRVVEKWLRALPASSIMAGIAAIASVISALNAA